MKLSTRGRYGARALVELAKIHGQGPLSLKEIASRQNIPLKYLEQIAMVLKDAGIVKSVRGPSGGYELSKSPGDLTLLEIIEVLEGSMSFVRCVKDPNSCSQVESCAFNDLWKRVAQETRKILRSVTLADMAKSDTEKKNSLVECLSEEMRENSPDL